MMIFVDVIRAPGYIFGPLILLSGLVALVICAWATRRVDRVAARSAVTWSLLPIALGLAGAAFGAAHWALTGKVAENRADTWVWLSYTVMFGLLVGFTPLLWSVVLVRRRPSAVA